MLNNKPLKIAIVVGEASGDLLGAGLIKALLEREPNAQFEGIGGPLMQAQGCVSHFPMEKLAVMGFGEVLSQLWDIFQIRRKLVKHFLANPPDVFIGIDAPDFNLGLERILHRNDIATVHYNSPKVWAWRSGRIKTIAQSINLMLVLLPFEAAFYEQQRVPVRFVGHPLADQIPHEYDSQEYKIKFGFTPDDKIVALLPGSRSSEMKYLASLFIDTAKWCLARQPDLKFIAPMANQQNMDHFQQLLQKNNSNLPIKVVLGQSRDAMGASDAILLACGTATLEALLLRKPMVVAYKVSNFTYHLAKHLVKVDKFSFPNLLSKEHLVPEFIQDNATPENLGQAIIEQLNNPAIIEPLLEQYKAIHLGLRTDANQRAAEAVLGLLAIRKSPLQGLEL